MLYSVPCIKTVCIELSQAIHRKQITGEDVSKIKKKHLSYPFAINNEQQNMFK
jgi:hypothetical protein